MKNQIIPRIDGLTNIMDRIRHFYVDWIVVFATSLLTFFFVSEPILNGSFLTLDQIIFGTFLCVYVLYYTIMEFKFSFTLGKLMNKTRVFSEEGGRANLGQIFIRTIIRLIPFGFIFQFTPKFQCLHDLISKTRVVKVVKEKPLQKL